MEKNWGKLSVKNKDKNFRRVSCIVKIYLYEHIKNTNHKEELERVRRERNKEK